jgi:hypothetical protein
MTLLKDLISELIATGFRLWIKYLDFVRFSQTNLDMKIV